jgi:phenylpropionate dioxygenase-like ring-hydroxylating dioxygenase large terminal subunit
MLPLKDPVVRDDWHVAARGADVGASVPVGVRMLGEDVVLWRSDEGVHAWKDLCIHRGAKLSLGKVHDGCLACPYHGWRYNGDGQCVHIPSQPGLKPPARAATTAYQVREKFGLIWVCLGTPAADVLDFPQWDDASFHKIICGPYHYDAAAPRAVENFMDPAHFAFVHEGILGDPARPEIGEHHAHVTAEGVDVPDIEIWQPNPDGTGFGRMVKQSYRIRRPFFVQFIKTDGPNCYSAMLAVTPVGEVESVGWVLRAMNYGHEFPPERFRAVQDLLVSQDVAVVETQRPELLPLDMSEELHLRADRTAIAYRQWIKSKGLRFGTR